jgi:ADP-ribose pyrophosphatase
MGEYNRIFFFYPLRPIEELFAGYGWKVTLDTAPLPDGRTKTALRVKRADTVHVIAETGRDTIIVIREFRPFYGEYIWMLPSGRADKENNDINVAAQRELQEETGYRAAHIEHLWTANHSETFICSNHIFLARDLTHDPLPQDDDELIEVHELLIEEALDKVLQSPTVHLTSAYALLRYLRERK